MEYVVVYGHNEAHAVKEAKARIDLGALGMPFQVTRIQAALAEDAEGYHGSLAPKDRPAPEPERADEN